MSAHTPGPWVAEWSEQRRAGQREAVARCVIGTPRNERGGRFVAAAIDGPFAGQRETAEANARLIAAAPEMLEALWSMVIAVDAQSPSTLNRALELARAAIAKATGGGK